MTEKSQDQKSTLQTQENEIACQESYFYSLEHQYDSFFYLDQQKQSFFRDKDWQEIEGSVIDWFGEKGVIRGQPQDIKIIFEQNARKNILLKKGSSEAFRQQNRIKRRFNRMLIVSV